MAAVQRGGAMMAPAMVRELRDAALADEHGLKLQAALSRLTLLPPLGEGRDGGQRADAPIPASTLPQRGKEEVR